MFLHRSTTAVSCYSLSGMYMHPYLFGSALTICSTTWRNGQHHAQFSDIFFILDEHLNSLLEHYFTSRFILGFSLYVLHHFGFSFLSSTNILIYLFIHPVFWQPVRKLQKLGISNCVFNASAFNTTLSLNTAHIPRWRCRHLYRCWWPSLRHTGTTSCRCRRVSVSVEAGQASQRHILPKRYCRRWHVTSAAVPLAVRCWRCCTCTSGNCSHQQWRDSWWWGPSAFLYKIYGKKRANASVTNIFNEKTFFLLQCLRMCMRHIPHRCFPLSLSSDKITVSLCHCF